MSTLSTLYLIESLNKHYNKVITDNCNMFIKDLENVYKKDNLLEFKESMTDIIKKYNSENRDYIYIGCPEFKNFITKFIECKPYIPTYGTNDNIPLKY